MSVLAGRLECATVRIAAAQVRLFQVEAPRASAEACRLMLLDVCEHTLHNSVDGIVQTLCNLCLREQTTDVWTSA